MNSVSTGSPARSQLGFCLFVSVGLGGIFKVGLGINGAAAYLYRALRPAPQAPQPGPHCARRPHGVTPRLRRARRGPRPTARPGLHRDKPNPPLREQTIRSGSRAWHRGQAPLPSVQRAWPWKHQLLLLPQSGKLLTARGTRRLHAADRGLLWAHGALKILFLT